MLLPQISTQPVSTNITNQSAKMSLVMSGKAFQVLSSSLYSHKIRAIIRELSTNAWDSHQDAGKPDTPFDIQLPTQLSPIFRIRDYGTGMDEEAIFGTYNVLFASTKTQTNQAVGCLGLGSKSPFAYTSAVTVTSYQDGLKSIYSSIMGTDGIPSMVKVLSMPTKDPDGLEIQFGVEPRDFNEFIYEAKYVFLTFLEGPEPNFLNCNLKIADIKANLIKITDNLYIADYNKVPHKSRSTYVIQGNVAYPLNRNMLTELADNALGHLGYQYIPFILVPIGTVDFQPSREGLNEQQENYDKITPFILDIEEGVTSKFRDQLASIKTLYDACEYRSKLYNNEVDGHLVSDYYFYKVMKEKGFAKESITKGWKTKSFNEEVKLLEISIVNGGPGQWRSILPFNSHRITTEGPQQLVAEKYTTYGGEERVRNVLVSPDPLTVYYIAYGDIISAQNENVFVEVDDNKKYKRKCAAHFKDTGKCRIVIRNSSDYPDIIADLKDSLPGFKWIKTSEMADVVTNRSTPKKRVMRRWFQKLNSYRNCLARDLETLESLGLDEEKPFNYIAVDSSGRGEYYKPYTNSPYGAVFGLMGEFKELKDTQFVLISNTHLEKLARHYPLAKSFKAEADRLINSRFTKDTVKELYSTSRTQNAKSINKIQALYKYKKLDESHDFYTEFKEVQDKVNTNTYDNMRDFYDLLDHFKINHKPTPIADKVMENFSFKYPLIDRFLSSLSGYGNYTLKQLSDNVDKLLKKETN